MAERARPTWVPTYGGQRHDEAAEVSAGEGRRRSSGRSSGRGPPDFLFGENMTGKDYTFKNMLPKVPQDQESKINYLKTGIFRFMNRLNRRNLTAAQFTSSSVFTVTNSRWRRKKEPKSSRTPEQKTPSRRSAPGKELKNAARRSKTSWSVLWRRLVGNIALCLQLPVTPEIKAYFYSDPGKWWQIFVGRSCVFLADLLSAFSDSPCMLPDDSVSATECFASSPCRSFAGREHS